VTNWRKSSYSRGGGTDCAELAVLGGAERGIRDSGRPGAPHPAVSRSALVAPVQGVKKC